MERGKQPAGFGIVRIKGEEFFESCRRPAVLAGIHMGDGFFQESAFLAVADNTPFVRP